MITTTYDKTREEHAIGLRNNVNMTTGSPIFTDFSNSLNKGP